MSTCAPSPSETTPGPQPQHFRGRVLSYEPAALPEDLAKITDFAQIEGGATFRAFIRVLPAPVRRRLLEITAAWRFFQQARDYEVVVTLGDLGGLWVAFLRRLAGRKQVHVMYDCLWYGGNRLKRGWMRYCISVVDLCVVWSSVECDRYAQAYQVKREKFLFIPHHHTINKYSFEIADGHYIFTGGNWSRDYRLFVNAVRDVNFPCVIATNRAAELLQGVDLPAHVKVVSASAQEFRELMARSTFVVLPLVAEHLHAGGQQTIVNAMAMGKPVIVTDPEGARDYISHGKNGFLVPPRDADLLEAAVRSLAEAPDRVGETGRAAFAFAKDLTTANCNEAIWREVLRLSPLT